MKEILFIGLLVVLLSAQTTVTPKLQACECSNLLNQVDCNNKNGCIWKFTTFQNSTTQSYTQQTTQGTCTNETTTAIVQIPTYCKNVINILQCSSTIGCAYVNNTCTIFAGCQAYLRNTHAACQAISKQCTTDGIRCILPTACLTYETQELCTKNIASSGAKSCFWNSANNGTCEDKKCSDAPRTFKTQQQCNNWIDGCLTNGVGCTLILNPCSQYQQINGCLGMIGSDGPCIANAGSNVCRPLVCTDAPQIYTANTACDAFLKGCLTNGKGCVTSYSACNTYTQTKGCAGLIGSDGPCIANRIRGSNSCRALACSDAPPSANTNAACSKFLLGCVTTGLGCIYQLQTCSSYQGSNITCTSYVGTDGKCRGISSKIEPCVARSCYDAPATTNTDQQCDAFQIGCVTTGAGCTTSLGTCSTYTGTSITCKFYKGTDGNCAAPITQSTPAACIAKVCQDAPTTITTNSGCQAFSYQCVTNGAGCINQQICELTELEVSCQGQSTCSLNQICINRSNCVNYLTQSQCLLNQQQYHPQGIEQTIYLRPCQWIASTSTCSNVLCSSLASTFITDAACSTTLPGCLTNGQGCVDISAPCLNYQGLTAQCQQFKGIGGIQLCSQLNTVSDPTNPCVAIILCSQANILSLFPQTSNTTCNSFLKGCFFDGKDNCTQEDCTSYYGSQGYCAAINTAPQACWKTVDLHDASTPCIVKQCSQASLSLNTDVLCNSFLKGCKWNGLESGGCTYPQSSCQSYQGTLSTCSNFYESNKQCTKSRDFCKPIICTNKIPPPSANTAVLRGIYCQQFTDFNSGYNCQMGQGDNIRCVDPQANTCKFFVAQGLDNSSKANYCQSLNYPGADACGYNSGDYCDIADCHQFTASGLNADQKATYCQNLIIDGTIQCGLASSTAAYCSNSTCTDYGRTQATCISYSVNCAWSQVANSCYTKMPICNVYIIPVEFQDNVILKSIYCSSVISNHANPGCSYQDDVSHIRCAPAPPACTNLTIPSSITFDQDKATFCVNQKIQDGITQCAYSTDNPATCAVLASCDAYFSYQPSDAKDDLTNQIFCQTLKDTNGRVCGFIIGTSACVVPPISCAIYQTYGYSYAENLALCSQLRTSNNIQCSYSQSSSVSGFPANQQCNNPDCGYISTGQSYETCRSYNSSCAFDGFVCITLNAACSGYNVLRQYQQAYCAGLTQIDGSKCGWTSGAPCTTRTCEQLYGSDANPITCSAYYTNCQYNGQSCVAMHVSCTNYVPYGTTDSRKAEICNAMMVAWGGKCTYIVGTASCVDTNACVYNLPQPFTFDQALAYCSLAQDTSGQKCGYQIGSMNCSPRMCNQAQKVSSDTDCNNFMQGCEQDTDSQCSVKACDSAPTTITTNSACAAYRFGCVTNGSGCLEATAMCAQYQGTKATCNGFTGNNIPCTNILTASASDSCISRTCVLNTTAKSNAECAIWFPPINGIVNCVWGGSLGCVPFQSCSQFSGTVDLCPTFIAYDGPCSGAGSDSAPSPCISYNSICTSAPRTYNTDALCKSWGQQCMTNGNGCMSNQGFLCQNIQTPLACSNYKSTPGAYCDLALQCKTIPQFCGMIITAFECNNILLSGQDHLTCGWNNVKSACVYLDCDLLPVTLITDNQCSSVISTCTTNGVGCITKGSCFTYPKQVCGVASTTDIQKACIWSKSACRPIQCTDNTTALTDVDCNTFLEGCRTPGLGCLAYITCNLITKPALCLFDSFSNPCLWHKTLTSLGQCIQFSQCTDMISSSHQECQSVSPLCTTNGVNCIAITTCSKTVLKASCIIGTDGQCGWNSDFGSCQLYTNCKAIVYGSLNYICQQWGSNCITDGKNCVERSRCSSYLNQISCIQGTDGKCFWDASIPDASIGTCRLQICQDAFTNYNLVDITTHAGCASFSASTPCTTSGTGCINQALCSSYTIQAGCVQGTDGACLWASQQNATSTTSVCNLKLCTDFLLTQSSQCKQEIPGVKCVSNGTNCIPQSTCSSYTAREACQGGGSDGVCAFSPGANITTPDIGTCSLFQQCSSANQDQIACNSRSDACYFNLTTSNGTTTSQCIPHTCATKAQGTSCYPVPSWDLSSYQICILRGVICTEGNPSQLSSQTCYNSSVGTYTWNMNTSSCTACMTKTIYNNTDLINNIYSQLVSVYIIIILII